MSEKTDIKNVIKLLASIMGYLGYYGIDDPPIIQKIFLYKNNLLKRGQVYRYYCTINT